MEIIGDKDKLIGLNFRAKEGFSGRIANENFFTFFRDAKIILNNDFIEKFKEKKIIINCETKKETTKFCNFLHFNDFKWANGESLKEGSWTPFYTNIGFISDKNLFDERYIASRRPQGIKVGIPRFLSAGIEINL